MFDTAPCVALAHIASPSPPNLMTTAIWAVTMGTVTPLPKSKAPSEVSIVKPQKKEPARYTSLVPLAG